MGISLQEIAGSRCGTTSGKVEQNFRNCVNKETDDGHRVSGLRALRKKKKWNKMIGRSRSGILPNMKSITVSLQRWRYGARGKY